MAAKDTGFPMNAFPPAGSEILTPVQMGEADGLTMKSGIGGQHLMQAAGHCVVAVLLAQYPDVRRAVVLCGPGNNGGDGYVVARLLKARGIAVVLHRDDLPRPQSDAADAASRWNGPIFPLAGYQPEPGDVVVDALYGAGFRGHLPDDAAALALRVLQSATPVVAIDLPSGIDGLSGKADSIAFRADHTVTFFRKKPGHLLLPGRDLCGSITVADIGISPRVLPELGVRLFENSENLFVASLPAHSSQTHKYARGMAGIFTGGLAATGAARLAALAAQRAGAGAVTLLAPDEAVPSIAAQVGSVMIRAVTKPDDLGTILSDTKFRAFLIGPGFGRFSLLKAYVLELLKDARRPFVLDADVFSSFALEGQTLFASIKSSGQPVILTPHAGEFSRVFPDLANKAMPKHERAREAAKLSGAIVILKGADTVIAAPDGRAAINSNGGPELATAGSGDVLAGLAVGLLAQGMPAFEAACAAVWHHGEAGRRLGEGLVAEQLAAEIKIGA